MSEESNEETRWETPSPAKAIVPFNWVTESKSVKSIAKAKAAFQAECPLIAKSGVNEHFRRGGKGGGYVQMEDIAPIVYPLLSKHDLAIVQKSRPVDGKFWLITKLIHCGSGEWFQGYWPMNPDKKGQQALGSEHTYARRRGIEQLTGIAFADDPADDDGEAAEARSVDHVSPRPGMLALEGACSENEEIINVYLLEKGHIKKGQTFRDAGPKLKNSILKNSRDLVAKAVAHSEQNGSE